MSRWGSAVCPQCGTEFERISHNQKYCRTKVVKDGRSACAMRHFNRKNYYANHEYRKKLHKENNVKWREQLRDKGLCVRCGKNDADDGFASCLFCLEARTIER